MDQFTIQMLQLVAFTLVASSLVAATAAIAATVTVKSNNNNAAQASPAKKQPLPPSVQSDLPLVVWAAANALASYYPSAAPTQIGSNTRPDTVVINGVTLDVHPGAWPTPILSPSNPKTSATSLSRRTRSSSLTRTRRPTTRTRTSTPSSKSTSTSSTSPTSSPSVTSTTSMSRTPTATPSHRHAHHHGPSEKVVAGVIGAFLILVAFSLMAFIFWALWRRKNTTGSYFKPVRYSIASVAVEPVRDQMHEGPWMGPATLHDAEEGIKGQHEEQGQEGDYEAAPAPFVPRSSTIRPVDASPPNYATFTPSRRSVERLRSRRLVSSRSGENIPSAELEGDRYAAVELDSSPSLLASSRLSGRLWSRRSSNADGDVTPRGTSRPLVVMHSPTTSSSDMLGSRTGSQGESRDGLAPMPITPPMPSYRDRRPIDLKLPTASHRFRDQRLMPMVHFSENSSPGVSPLIQGQSSRTPSPNYREPSPVVHYPSFTEISEFDFTGDGSSPPRSGPSPEYGDDGWRRDGDSIFGRYELG